MGRVTARETFHQVLPRPAAAPPPNKRAGTGASGRRTRLPGTARRARPGLSSPAAPARPYLAESWCGAAGRAGRGSESRLAGACARQARRGFRHVSDVGTTWGPRTAHSTAHSGVEAPAEKPAEAGGGGGGARQLSLPPPRRAAPPRPRLARPRATACATASAPSPGAGRGGSREGRPGAGRGPGRRPAAAQSGSAAWQAPGPAAVELAELPFRLVLPQFLPIPPSLLIPRCHPRNINHPPSLPAAQSAASAVVAEVGPWCHKNATSGWRSQSFARIV